jgi:hypothetical protein
LKPAVFRLRAGVSAAGLVALDAAAGDAAGIVTLGALQRPFYGDISEGGRNERNVAVTTAGAPAHCWCSPAPKHGSGHPLLRALSMVFTFPFTGAGWVLFVCDLDKAWGIILRLVLLRS